MNTERPVFHINPTPTLPSRGCRMLARILGWALSYGYFAVALFVWWKLDWFFAIAFVLLGFILTGIVRSKLRNDSIPPAQREYSYDDYAIATWYLSRNHCFEMPSKPSSDIRKECAKTGDECEDSGDCTNAADAHDCSCRHQKY